MYGRHEHRDTTVILRQVAHMGRTEINTEFWWGNRNERDNPDDLRVDGKTYEN